MTDPGLADATYVEPITRNRREDFGARAAGRAVANHGGTDGAQYGTRLSSMTVSWTGLVSS